MHIHQCQSKIYYAVICNLKFHYTKAQLLKLLLNENNEKREKKIIEIKKRNICICWKQ